MEVDIHLISLQTELRTFDKNGDKFKRIKYKGGNEETIDQIIDAVKVYYCNANLSTKKKHRQQFLQFLLLNSNIQNTLLITKEIQHLVNIIPTLSSCVIAHIIVNLDFINDYSELMLTFSLSLNKELLYELEICLKQGYFTNALSNTSKLLKALIALFQVNEKDGRDIQEICDIANEMLKNIVYFSPEKLQELQFSEVRQHMGYSLLEILQIINLCPLYHVHLTRFIDCTIHVAIKIMEAVTLTVFCMWAQVKCENGQPLQLVVAEEAYRTIEHLEKFKPGGELIQMLSAIARKPKTLRQKILEADLSAVIFHIDRCDENQVVWFHALIAMQVFENEDAVKCLEKWHRLCAPTDISRLLNLCRTSRDITLTCKCARTISCVDLKNVVIKFFWEYTTVWSENISNELTVFLNKFENGDESETTKTVLLLTLQNRQYMLQALYGKCLEKSANISKFKYIFNTIKDIIAVNSFGKTIFLEILQRDLPKEENVVYFRDLLDMLLEIKYFTDTTVIDILHLCLQCTDSDSVLPTLTLFNTVTIEFRLSKGQCNLIITLLNLLERYRALFYQLHTAPAITQGCIDLLCKFNQTLQSFDLDETLNQLELTRINRYYAINLNSNYENTFLQYMYMSETTRDCAECVAKLLNLLPICVKSEWILIANEVIEQFGYSATLKLFHNVLFSISQLKGSVEVDSKLIYCLQQYSVILKDIIQPKHTTLKEEQIFAKHLCTLLKIIPQNICNIEAPRLTGLLRNEVLMSLKDDREFILLLVAIQDTGVSQLLVQRMLQH